MATILAIDDEPELLQQVRNLLEAEGHQVETAEDGETGLRKARDLSPSLILLDVLMPGIDGFEVLTRIKRDKATWHIPVVMLTAKGESQSMFKAQELQAHDYLIKPFSVQTFLDLIRRYTI